MAHQYNKTPLVPEINTIYE